MQILVATDFSDIARGAAEQAVDYARRLGARLHLLHVVWPDDDGSARAHLTDLTRELAPAVETVVAVSIGRAVTEIVRYADRHAVDLIVMGTHGRTGVSRMLTGSVAEGVVRTAGRPVLTVPQSRPIGIAPTSEPTPIPRCLVCACASEDSICAGCRARIRGQALARKGDAEKSGHPF